MTATAYENIRAQMWERKFPGCIQDFQRTFGSALPSPKVVAEWKNTWNETSPYVYELSFNALSATTETAAKSNIYAVTERLGIHPYFWEYSKRRQPFLHQNKQMVSTNTVFVTPIVTFFYEEHLVMFKLAW